MLNEVKHLGRFVDLKRLSRTSGPVAVNIIYL